MVGYVSFLEGIWSSFFAYLRWISNHRLFTKKTGRGLGENNSTMIWPRKNALNWVNLSGIKIPSRELTYPTLGKGTSSSNIRFWRDMLVPRKGYGFKSPTRKTNGLVLQNVTLVCFLHKKTTYDKFSRNSMPSTPQRLFQKRSHHPNLSGCWESLKKKTSFFLARLKVIQKVFS